VADIRDGKGTAGKLLEDDAVRASLAELQKQSSELAAGLRKDPKKYFTIDFRIF
jgi:hypothetical protein